MKKDFNKQLKEEFNHTFEPTIDKELLKEAIDKAKSAQEMVVAVLTLLNNMQQ